MTAPREGWGSLERTGDEAETIDIAELLTSIRDRVFTRRIRVEDRFRDFDRLRCGRCTKQQFFRVVQSLHPDVEEDEGEALAEHFTQHGLKVRWPQVVNYVKFVEAVDLVFGPARSVDKAPATQVLRPGALAPSTYGYTPFPLPDMDRFHELLKRIAALTETRGVALFRCFQRVSHAATGSVFPKGCGKLSEFVFMQKFPFVAEFTIEELDMLFERYRTEHRGIHAYAFAREVEAAVEERRLERERAQRGVPPPPPPQQQQQRPPPSLEASLKLSSTISEASTEQAPPSQCSSQRSRESAEEEELTLAGRGRQAMPAHGDIEQEVPPFRLRRPASASCTRQTTNGSDSAALQLSINGRAEAPRPRPQRPQSASTIRSSTGGLLERAQGLQIQGGAARLQRPQSASTIRPTTSPSERAAQGDQLQGAAPRMQRPQSASMIRSTTSGSIEQAAAPRVQRPQSASTIRSTTCGGLERAAQGTQQLWSAPSGLESRPPSAGGSAEAADRPGPPPPSADAAASSSGGSARDARTSTAEELASSSGSIATLAAAPKPRPRPASAVEARRLQRSASSGAVQARAPGTPQPLTPQGASAQAPMVGTFSSIEARRKLAENMPKVDVLTKVRGIVYERRLRVAEHFRDFDKLRRGVCTASHMKAVLSLLGVDLNAETLACLLDLYRAEDGHFNYTDFCMDVEDVPPDGLGKCRPTLTAEEERELKKLKTTLATVVRLRRMEIRSVFDDFRRRGDNTPPEHVTMPQVGRIFSMLGFALSERQVHLLCKAYCDKANGAYANYVDLLADIDPPPKGPDLATAARARARQARYFDERGKVVPRSRPLSAPYRRRTRAY